MTMWSCGTMLLGVVKKESNFHISKIKLVKILITIKRPIFDFHYKYKK